MKSSMLFAGFPTSSCSGSTGFTQLSFCPVNTQTTMTITITSTPTIRKGKEIIPDTVVATAPTTALLAIATFFATFTASKAIF